MVWLSCAKIHGYDKRHTHIVKKKKNITKEKGGDIINTLTVTPNFSQLHISFMYSSRSVCTSAVF